MNVRIAIPEPTSDDAAYNARSLPPYLAALQSVGATPVLIPLHEREDRIARLLAGTQGLLLPGSGFDVDPQRYRQARISACGPSDSRREEVDRILLQDAFDFGKPVLAICYGIQSLNVWLNGTLVQDVETVLKTFINHAPGRDVVNAHTIRISANSRLNAAAGGVTEESCNSSHHQAIAIVGDKLRVTAVCPQDGIIEAVELDSASHFVVGVQWHPERTYIASPLSRALFAAFVHSVESSAAMRLEKSVAFL